MRADDDAARFRQFDGVPHDIGIAGMKTAGDVDRGGKLDHGGVVAHLPRSKALAEIAVEIDCCHDDGPLAGWMDQSGVVTCQALVSQVWVSMALTAEPATLASCSASRLRSKCSMSRSRSGRASINCTKLRSSFCASAMPIA